MTKKKTGLRLYSTNFINWLDNLPKLDYCYKQIINIVII